MTAWGEAPGQDPENDLSALKGRDKCRVALTGLGDSMRAWLAKTARIVTAKGHADLRERHE